MAQICKQCGKRIGVFSNDYISISDEYILCYGCAEPIKTDLTSLYSIKSLSEFNECKGRILKNSIGNFNETVLECIKRRIDKYDPRSGDEIEQNMDDASFSSNDGLFKNQYTSSLNLDNNTDKPIVISDSIGSKIKALAQVLTWVGILCSVILGIILMATDESLIFSGLIIAILGSLSSWVSSFVLYGFGQLIENTDKLVELSKNKNLN